MKICIIGTGYVGLVTGAVFSSLGNDVVCVDKNIEKIQHLNNGVIPIYEDGLEELIISGVEENKLRFSIDLASSVHESEIIFLAVGTPPKLDGSTDLSAIAQSAYDVAEHMVPGQLVVTKSTVPVGTGALIKQIIDRTHSNNLGFEIPYDIASNPEFLREGTAVEDTLHPDRIIIGATTKKAIDTLTVLYKPIKAPVIVTDIESSEMIKYAANAFLATKITFANSIAQICEANGANITQVMYGIGIDKRIGPDFLVPGIGYGGACFPKDTASLLNASKRLGCESLILDSVIKTNNQQPLRFVERIQKVLGVLNEKTIGVLGLAFKGNTDDVRESRAIDVINALIIAGANVRAYDPVANENAKFLLPSVTFCNNEYETALNADALLIVTNWSQFGAMDFKQIATNMYGRHLFDGRNVCDARSVVGAGLIYHGVGMPTILDYDAIPKGYGFDKVK